MPRISWPPSLPAIWRPMLVAAERWLAAEGIELWLVGLNPRVLAMVDRSPLGEAIGRSRMFYTVHDAIERHLASRA